MARSSYSKSDVQRHSDNGYDRKPAVNIKAHLWEHGDHPNASFRDEMLREIATDNGYDADHFLAWWRTMADSFDPHSGLSELDKMIYSFQELDCEDQFAWAREQAGEIFGGSPDIWQEGRSGDWMVVGGLSDFDYWDAIDLGKWRKFERIIRGAVEDHAYRVASLICINPYAAEVEEADRERAAADAYRTLMTETEAKWTSLARLATAG